MHKRLYLILALFAGLALACNAISIQWSSTPPQKTPLPVQVQAVTPAPSATRELVATQGVFLPQVPSGAGGTAEATQGIFLPDVSSGAGSTANPSTPQAPAPAGPGASTPTLNSLYLPEVNSGAGSPSSSATPVTPQVEIEASAVTLQVGDVVTVTARPSGIGMPYYDLVVQEQVSAQPGAAGTAQPGAAGTAQPQVLVEVTYENQIKPQSGTSQVFEFVSAEGKMDQATFVLRAKAAGTASIGVTAAGEIQDESGAYMWGEGGSEPLEITVRNNP